MKKCAITLLCLSVMIYAQQNRGQGTFEMTNYNPDRGVNAPVFDAIGAPLAGTNYLALLFGGPDTNSLQPAVAEFSASAAVPFLTGTNAGYFDIGNDFVRIPTVGAGNAAWLQVVAWDARLGATYQDVVNLGIGGYGQSLFFQEMSGGGGPTPALPSPLVFLQSFNLLPIVPEPSAALLLLLGLHWVLWRTRFRK